MDKPKKFAIGAVIFGVIGYIAGLLTAPKSGKETREDIKRTAANTMREAEKQLKKLHTELDEVIAAATPKLDELKGKAQEELQMLLDKAKKVKEKARIALSAVHEGETDDKDLQEAIDEAGRIIQSLKRFATK